MNTKSLYWLAMGTCLMATAATGCALDSEAGENSNDESTSATDEENAPQVVENEDHYLVEGDIVVPKDEPAQVEWVKSMLGEEAKTEGMKVRSVRPSASVAWPDGKLRYYFDSNVSQATRDLFVSACWEWEAVADIECIESTAGDYRYRIVHDSTLGAGVTGSSSLGYIKSPRLRFKSATPNKGTFIHEIGHGLGFTHEHKRSNRDDYVIVNSSDTVNYGKETGAVELGINYDFCSIMHYPLGSAIQLKDPSFDPGCTVGQRTFLSWGDRLGAVDFYGEKMSTVGRCSRDAHTLRTLTVPSANTCEALCSTEKDCRAWTFQPTSLSCTLHRNTGESIYPPASGAAACGIKLSDMYQLPNATNNNGYEAFLDGIRVSNVPGWTQTQAADHCNWYYQKLKPAPDAMVECRYKGTNMGYELFWDFRRISVEAGYTRAQAEANCRWNRETYGSGTSRRIVSCRFQGEEILVPPVI